MGLKIAIYGMDRIGELPEGAALVITTGYHREEYRMLQKALPPRISGDTVYYFANRDTEYYEHYLERYRDSPLEDIIDFLILFVVEEDRSDFSFAERFAMLRAGTADLDRVMAVPSGLFILSQMTFPEYFLKETRETLIENTENDIKLFAEKIAPRLGIRCRFCGEEPLDEVTGQYNRAMEKILPQYGIEAVIIPRKEAGGEVISASRVRRCLEEGNVDRLDALLPETTKRILGLTEGV